MQKHASRSLVRQDLFDEHPVMDFCPATLSADFDTDVHILPLCLPRPAFTGEGKSERSLIRMIHEHPPVVGDNTFKRTVQSPYCGDRLRWKSGSAEKYASSPFNLYAYLAQDTRSVHRYHLAFVCSSYLVA